jgi:hypothetical protein
MPAESDQLLGECKARWRAVRIMSRDRERAEVPICGMQCAHL